MKVVFLFHIVGVATFNFGRSDVFIISKILFKDYLPPIQYSLWISRSSKQSITLQVLQLHCCTVHDARPMYFQRKVVLLLKNLYRLRHFSILFQCSIQKLFSNISFTYWFFIHILCHLMRHTMLIYIDGYKHHVIVEWWTGLATIVCKQ